MLNIGTVRKTLQPFTSPDSLDVRFAERAYPHRRRSGGRQVAVEKASAGVARRVLLTAGGLTQLGIYSTGRAGPDPVAARTGKARHAPVLMDNAFTNSPVSDPRVTASPARTRAAAMAQDRPRLAA